MVFSKTYSNSQYAVSIQPNGAIQVKHGDWLSKYSAAIYNDFTRIHEFGRMDKAGKLRPIHNPDIIYTGETIYHIPTYRKAHPMRMDAIEIKASPLTDEQRQRIIVDTLTKEFHLGEAAKEFMIEAAHITHGVDTVVQIVEIAGLIAEGTAGATAVQLLSAVLTPIMIALELSKALDTDARIIRTQASCYALTAWAFDHSIPKYPPTLRARYAQFWGQDRLPRAEEAWKEGAEEAVRILEKEVTKKRRFAPSGVHKESYQAYLQALGGADPKRLAKLCLQARAEEASGSEKTAILVGIDPDQYPH
jgi:hypothetical protein